MTTSPASRTGGPQKPNRERVMPGARAMPRRRCWTIDTGSPAYSAAGPQAHAPCGAPEHGRRAAAGASRIDTGMPGSLAIGDQRCRDKLATSRRRKSLPHNKVTSKTVEPGLPGRRAADREAERRGHEPLRLGRPGVAAGDRRRGHDRGAVHPGARRVRQPGEPAPRWGHPVPPVRRPGQHAAVGRRGAAGDRQLRPPGLRLRGLGRR